MANPEPAGLYLIVEAISGHAGQERLKAALTAAPIASVLIARRDGVALDAASARPLVELVQAHEAAALIDNDAQLARTLRADGVHLRHSDDLEARFREAREVLGQRYIVGAEAGGSRHDAMMLGELGAEYVAFGPGDDQAAFVGWWAEIFELPCVAFDVADAATGALMAQAGADFIGFALPVGETAGDVQARVRAFGETAAMRLPVEAS